MTEEISKPRSRRNPALVVGCVVIGAALAFRVLYDLKNPGLLAAKAPDFTTTTTGNQPLTLHSLRGRVVLIDFWATWCEPCFMAVPMLKRLQTTYAKQGLVVIGMCLDQPETVGSVPDYIQTNGIEYIVSADPVANAKIKHDYRVTSLPTAYLIDRNGNIAWTEEGYSPDEQSDLKTAVEKALAQH
jgi:thiol-disulfide isomerase/thioredoxin